MGRPSEGHGLETRDTGTSDAKVWRNPLQPARLGPDARRQV
ncbi:MAG: hypothetical protein AVDCRST_MAG64-559 [uncultured Phycisphaerae bacterium]|uniref:Uncharacterized protein n=1 Tax=uncultured Phycisphaerae bacterium TaxID=904963 RepID=A0A6J4N6T3_9BACT|nr:MAG: hypothetical protein AVDCRST_MAG64-559 [uncultured Phycisphaerae bacterium]